MNSVEREERRVELVMLAVGIIEDYDYNVGLMKEELQVLLDDDKHGFFVEPETYFMIIDKVDNEEVHRFLLEYIRDKNEENLKEIFEREPELIGLLPLDEVSDELREKYEKSFEENSEEFYPSKLPDPEDWKTGWDW